MSIQDPTSEDGVRSIQEVSMNTAEIQPDAIPHACPSPSTIDEQLQEPSANQQPSAAPGDAESPLATPNVPKTKICGVCNEKPSKYKCTRCYLPYCSVACSTIHKATHPTLTTPSPTNPVEVQAEKPNGAALRAGTVAAAGAKGPFAGLDQSVELRSLFKMYPRLGLQLEEIYRAMQAPVGQEDSVQTAYLRAAGKMKGQQKPWNADRGMMDGRAALGRARERWGKDGEGVREFGELVLRIVGGEDVAESVQRELTEQDKMIVEQLLNAGL